MQRLKIGIKKYATVMRPRGAQNSPKPAIMFSGIHDIFVHYVVIIIHLFTEPPPLTLFRIPNCLFPASRFPLPGYLVVAPRESK